MLSTQKQTQPKIENRLTSRPACSNRLCKRTVVIVIVQRPHVGAAKLVLLDIGSLRSHRSRGVVGIEGSGGRIVERRSRSCRIVPSGIPVFVCNVLDRRVGQKSRSQQSVTTWRSSRLDRIGTQTRSVGQEN